MKEKILPVIKKFLVFCIVFAIIFGVKEYKEANKMNEEFAAYAGVNSSQVADAVTIVKDKSATCTVDGITVTVKEAINDEHMVSAFLEVRSESDIVLDSQCVFDFGNFDKIQCFPVGDGKTLNMVVDVYSLDKIDDDKFGILLIDLVKSKDRELVKKGEWKLSFKLADGDISKDIEVENTWQLPSSINGDREYIDLKDVELDVSPMSIYLEGEYDESVDDSVFTNSETEYSILTADGKWITGTFSHRMIGQDDGKKVIELFDVPEGKIESEIKEVIINGMEVPFDK